jgi:hypothetical protein
VDRGQRRAVAASGSYERDHNRGQHNRPERFRTIGRNGRPVVPYVYRGRVYPQAAANVAATITEYGEPAEPGGP